MHYQNVVSAVVRALAAETINSAGGCDMEPRVQAAKVPGTLSGKEERMLTDFWIHGRLHKMLIPRHWDALVAKFSTHKGRKVESIGALRPLIASPAPKLFVYKAVTAWAIPKLKGARLALAPEIAIDVPVDATPAKQAAIIAAALSAERVKRSRVTARSADMIVLADSFYDMNTWDLDGRPESTRREWRRKINEVLDEMVAEALVEAGKILQAEGLIFEEEAA
ncbi:hypothetical protein [Stutzerimonas stutzeri]|uniref:hypothetical protein n=1 Tax=Stutzerimonas stutzeri TaxID=316 RepID=UPI00066DB9AD|nr:hypothetical protein [Stutzerimonas stutzeri]